MQCRAVMAVIPFPRGIREKFSSNHSWDSRCPCPPNPPGQSVSSVLPQWWPLHESDVRTRPPSLRPLARDPQRPSGLELVENLRELQLLNPPYAVTTR